MFTSDQKFKYGEKLLYAGANPNTKCVMYDHFQIPVEYSPLLEKLITSGSLDSNEDLIIHMLLKFYVDVTSEFEDCVVRNILSHVL